MFSHEVTYQLITAVYEGEEYELWNSELRGIDEPNEYKQKLSSLNADLVSPNVDFIFPNHANENLDFYGSTICRWESDLKSSKRKTTIRITLKILNNKRRIPHVLLLITKQK